MSLLATIGSAIVGEGVAKPIEAVGNVLDQLFTSDDERLSHEEVKMRLALKPSMAQNEINKVEATHRSVFVAGWRPAIGWVAGISLALFYIPQYAAASYLWVYTVLTTGKLVPYPTSAEGLMQLVLAMLGMGALRTFEKMQGKTK